MKKFIKYFIVFIAAFVLCVSVKALDYYTLYETQIGSLSKAEIKDYAFTLPVDSRVDAIFIGENYDLDDDIWGTTGDFIFRILDSEGNVIKEQKKYLWHDDYTFSIDLLAGDYTFRMIGDSYSPDYIFYITATPETTVPTESLAMQKASVALVRGKSTVLKVNLDPIYSVGPMSWSSSNTKIATVDSNGKVVAKNLGRVKITVEKDGNTASSIVAVNKTPTIKLIKKKTVTFAKYVKYISGYKKAKWSSSKKSVVTVDKKGNVYAKNSGKANIYATIKGKKYTIPVKVVPLVAVASAGVSEEYIYNDAEVRVTNNSSKAIKYMTLQITQYNNKGSKLRSPYSYYYINETIPANSSEYYTFWVNDDTKRIKVKVIKVWFKGGGTWRP